MKNVDNHWIEPIVEAFHDFFLVIGEPGMPTIPMKISATGAQSIIAKEIKLENMFKFMQITAAPQDAILTDRVKMIKTAARLLEEDDMMRSDPEIKMILAHMAQLSAQTPPAGGGNGPTPSSGVPKIPSGG
jgi:hypothetical protein